MPLDALLLWCCGSVSALHGMRDFGYNFEFAPRFADGYMSGCMLAQELVATSSQIGSDQAKGHGYRAMFRRCCPSGDVMRGAAGTSPSPARWIIASGDGELRCGSRWHCLLYFCQYW